MSDLSAILEYEDILLGKRKNFSATNMGIHTKEQSALRVIQFATEKILRWSPETIALYINPELIHLLHLQRPLSKVKFPAELDPERDLFYLAQAIYPDKIRYSKTKIILRIYQRIMDKRQPKYPKNFFIGASGLINACICLQYAINQNVAVHSIQELYDKFSNEAWAISFLRANRLYVPFYQNYEYPIDMLHDALPEESKDDLFYHRYRFKTDFEAAKRRNLHGSNSERKKTETE